VERDLSLIKPKEPNSASKRALYSLSEHAFDESDRFVKVYIPHKCLQLTEDQVKLEMTKNSFRVTIAQEDKDYEFKVVSLLKDIDVDKSYKKVKSEDQMVALYLKKIKEGMLHHKKLAKS
jgi:CS domain